MDAETFKEFVRQLTEQIRKEFEQKQKEYVELSNEMTELSPYIEAMSEKMLVLSMEDQMSVMEKIIELGKLEKTMCEKYDIDIYADSDYEEE